MKIVKTNILPDIFSPVYNIEGKLHLQGMKNIRFYFSGGVNVLALCKAKAGDLFTVFIPPMSELPVNPDDLATIVKELANDIVGEMKNHGIQYEEWFLFDTKTKRVIRDDSFMDYIPMWQFGKSLFVSDDCPGKIMYINDRSKENLLSILGMMVAKNKLLRRNSGIDFSDAGKLTLTYLLARDLMIPVAFTSLTNPWQRAQYIFPEEFPKDSPLTENLNLGRASEIALGILQGSSPTEEESEDEDNPFSTTTSSGQGVETPIAERIVCMSDVVTMGVRAFCGGPYSGIIEIVIDMLGEDIKDALIDMECGILFVSLVPGSKKDEESLKEDLGADQVVIVESLNDTRKLLTKT
nr:hypothetical protein [Pseudoxanthomonas sp.]